MPSAGNQVPPIHDVDRSLSQRAFLRLGGLIYEECGIKMAEGKKAMLEARIGRRVKALGLTSSEEYCNYLFSPEGMREEFVNMIDVVTTNKTDFFREPHHFRYLFDTVLPGLLHERGIGKGRRLLAWSAACSTGEEPYTLSMVIGRFAEGKPGYDFSIVASDISTTVLRKAAAAVYEEEKAEPIPAVLKKKYLLRSKDHQKKLVRIAPEARARVEFRRLNLMDDDYGFRDPFHVIFCRNVIIYFDHATQERLLKRLCGNLVSGGYIFMGHSETLSGIDLPLVQSAPTVYRKTR